MESRKGQMKETPLSAHISTKLARIAELAREDPQRSFLSLAHHIDVDFLEEAYRRVRKDGAVGVDGQTAEEFAKDLQGNLERLLEGLKSGSYRAPPVRRVHIPKGDGKKTRPLGIPTFADKVLQMAVSMVLTMVYEQDFLDCSYGFRPKRGAHQALEALRGGLMEMGGGWVIDADIQGFFDNLDHGKLREILDQRVRDGVLRRTIDKWLKAGVLEDGQLTRPEGGTPQGGVISPTLANIYLHTVLDTWFHHDVLPRLRGPAFMIRYADDFVLVFALEADAKRVFEVLPKRFARFGLTIHPEKTRLLQYRRPRHSDRGKGKHPSLGRPGSFDFLGFTHYWGRSCRGYWVALKKTCKSRLNRSLKAVAEWCRTHRHWRIGEQRAILKAKLDGHYAYYGVTGNYRSLAQYYVEVQRIWRKWLSRRSQKGMLSWARFAALQERYPLPRPRIVQRYVTWRNRGPRSRMR